MTRETLVPAIPEIRDDNIKEVLSAIKATLQVREGNIGDPLDQAATLRDLVALNVADPDTVTTNNAGNQLPVGPIVPLPSDGYIPEKDFTTPPAPTGFVATGGFSNCYLSWTGANYRNHAYTEIWRSQTNNVNTAVRVGTTVSNVYADAAVINTTYYYWIRFVSVANVTGPWNNTTGTAATTAVDVSSAYDAIFNATVANGNYNSGVPFIYLSSPLTIGGITYPAGTWIKDSFIANATISSAKIQSLVADKITTGTLSASIGIRTGYIAGGITPGIYPPGHQFFGTGFFLGNYNGTQQFYIGSSTNNLLWNGTDLQVKGIIYANAGAIGTNILDANGLRSSNFAANSAGWRLQNSGSAEFNDVYLRGQLTAGASTGYAYNPNGQWGLYIGPSGFLMGNAFAGRYFSIDGSGNVYAPGFQIVNGSATFSGNVSANTLSTNSGRFTAYADGSVVADLVDIRRRLVLETGALDPAEFVIGTDGNGNYYGAGTVFIGEIYQIVFTNIYDSNTQNTYANQPYYVSAYFTGSQFRNYSGGTTEFNLKLTASVEPVRTYSNTGSGGNDYRLALTFKYEIKLVSGTFNSFRLPTASWTLYKL